MSATASPSQSSRHGFVRRRRFTSPRVPSHRRACLCESPTKAGLSPIHPLAKVPAVPPRLRHTDEYIQASLSPAHMTSGGGLRLAQEGADLGLAVTAVTTESAQRRQLPSPGPPSDGLGVDPKEGCDLSRGQQGLGVKSAAGHAAPPVGHRMPRRTKAAANSLTLLDCCTMMNSIRGSRNEKDTSHRGSGAASRESRSHQYLGRRRTPTLHPKPPHTKVLGRGAAFHMPEACTAFQRCRPRTCNYPGRDDTGRDDTGRGDRI
jgi:hypothetical protein